MQFTLKNNTNIVIGSAEWEEGSQGFKMFSDMKILRTQFTNHCKKMQPKNYIQ
jgi:hypothetical protein